MPRLKPTPLFDSLEAEPAIVNGAAGGFVNVNSDRYQRDQDGQWWYIMAFSLLRRTRAFPKICTQCNKPFLQAPSIPTRKGRNGSYCSRRCSTQATAPAKRERRGDKHYSWKGGRRITKKGYVAIYKPDYPGPKYGGKYAWEHRLVMEEILGRLLYPFEQVHHKNGIKTDNRPENLEIWVRSHPDGVRADDGKHCPTCTCHLTDGGIEGVAVADDEQANPRAPIYLIDAGEAEVTPDLIGTLGDLIREAGGVGLKRVIPKF